LIAVDAGAVFEAIDPFAESRPGRRATSRARCQGQTIGRQWNSLSEASDP
jgi:hypothetical protein